MGFPTADDFGSMFGVTDEDRQKWDQKHAANAARRANSSTVKQMLDKSAQQAIGLGKMMVQAKLYGREAYAAEQEYEDEHVTMSTTGPDGTTVTEKVSKKDFTEEMRDAVPNRRRCTAESYRDEPEAAEASAADSEPQMG